LVCNQENKKIIVDGQGNISIIEAGIPNNEIWYTSSDGNIVTPYKASSLPEIDTNTYSAGKGVIKFKTNVTSIGGSAFRDCTGLTSVTIPNSVTSIGSSAFNGCTGLTSVTIPNSITSIGDYAFSACDGLTKVNIMDIASWCNIAFSNSINNPLYYAKHLYVNNVEVINLVIPEGVTSIGSYAFYNCTGLTSVTIPNSVTSIGSSAFQGCTSLTSSVYNAHVFAYMPTSYSGAYTITDGIKSITGNAFNGCTGLTSVTIPNSVTSIGQGAFSWCTGLTSIEIPNSVISIGSYAFNNCSSLTSIEIPNSVTSIGKEAFGLTSAKILFSKLYSTYTNKILSGPIADATYTVEFNISEIPTDYNISSMLPKVADDGKCTLTYNIYTDYAPCKDQALALVTQKTIVNVYHIDGTPWE
jgi:hypothetical protein